MAARVVFGGQIAMRHIVANQEVNHIAVFAVHHHQHAGLGRLQHGAEERGIVHLVHALVRCEQLKGGYAGAHQ